MKLGIGHIAFSLMLAAGLLAGVSCSRESVGREGGEIRFHVVEDWQSATKVSLYGGGSLSTSGCFGVTAYSGGTTTKYISDVTVNYDDGSSAWVFEDGKHYWPASGTLDFHAWMPEEKPEYIKMPTYSYASGPGFTCQNLPLTSGDQASLQEYVYAFTKDQSKTGNGTSGVVLDFKRPFALITFQQAVPHTDMTLNNITITSVKNNGAYTHSGGWTPTGGSGSFVAGSLGTYLVMPQDFSPQTIEVTFTPEEEDAPITLRGTIPSLSWAAGKYYVYTFLLKMNFTLTVTEMEEDAPNVTNTVSVEDMEEGEWVDYTYLIILT